MPNSELPPVCANLKSATKISLCRTPIGSYRPTKPDGAVSKPWFGAPTRSRVLILRDEDQAEEKGVEVEVAGVDEELEQESDRVQRRRKKNEEKFCLKKTLTRDGQYFDPPAGVRVTLCTSLEPSATGLEVH